MTNWEAIVASHGTLVWRTLWRLLADRADVDECFQETFLAALVYSRRHEVDCWPALLCRLATARGIDRLRSRYRQVRLEPASRATSSQRLAEVASADAGPVEHAVAAELTERLREALAQLPAQQAEAFYLHAFCGWSQQEIAERLQMTAGAVSVTVHRARGRLRELLSETS